jgi:signal transduction histidine kinase
MGRGRTFYLFAWAAFLASLVVLAVSGALGRRALGEYRDAAGWVDHTHEVLRVLTATEVALTTAEVHQRNLLITREDRFAARAVAAADEARARVGDLLRLTADNPSQQERLGRLRTALGERLGTIDRGVGALRAGGLPAAAAVISEGRGTELADRVHALAEEAAAEEERLLEERDARARRAEARARALTGVAVGAGVVLVALGVLVTLAARRAAAEIRGFSETLERKAAARTAELEEANASLEAFGYTVSHDLRAPLRAMQGFGVALLEDYAGALDERGRGYAARIVRAAERMDRLIEDLLAYSRLARADLRTTRVDLEEVLDAALAQAGPGVRAAGADLTVRRPLVAAMAERTVLVQASANLLSNAAKFVPPGAAPRIEVWTDASAGVVRLHVRDRGLGIAPEHPARVFRVFERLHSAEAYPGTGVELAIVKRGVERMGGRVALDSAPGAAAPSPANCPQPPSPRSPTPPRPAPLVRRPPHGPRRGRLTTRWRTTPWRR